MSFLRKTIAFILVFIMLFSLVFTADAYGKDTYFASGDGSAEDPFVIETAQQLFRLAELVNSEASLAAYSYYYSKCYKLASDITLNDETFTFIPDSGLVHVSDGVNTAYLGTGIRGDQSGKSTVFDASASEKGVWYVSEHSSEKGAYTGSLIEWIPIGNTGVYNKVDPNMSVKEATALYGTLYTYDGYEYKRYSEESSSDTFYYCTGHSFTGNFDGGGHTISGIYINGNFDYQGLFGDAFSDNHMYHISGIDEASIYDMSVTNSYICANENVGAIVGFSSTPIINCHSDAIICGNKTVGGIAGKAQRDIIDCTNKGTVFAHRNAGGIAGETYYTYAYVENCANFGSVFGNYDVGGILGTLRNFSQDCTNTGLVTAYCENAGGAVGICNGTIFLFKNSGIICAGGGAGGVAGMQISGTIYSCLNTGQITATYEYEGYAGGIAGKSKAIVASCENRGEICGIQNIGGIIGINCDDSNDMLTVISCFDSGVVRSNGKAIDCSIGYSNPIFTSFINVYRLDTDGENDPRDNGTSFFTTGNLNKDDFALSDFNNCWTVEPSTGIEHPQLIAFMDKDFGENSAIWDGTVADGFDSGSGTKNDPYIIMTAQQLAFLAQSINNSTLKADSYIKLGADISLNDISKHNWTLTATEWICGGGVVYPSHFKGFNGNFDGNGHTISGLYINTVRQNQGLFGINHGAITNLRVTDSYICSGGNVGAIAGDNDGVITNCFSDCTVVGVENVGGIAGKCSNLSSIINCSSNSSIMGVDYIGGISGFTVSSHIESCFNSGPVAGIDIIGGITGFLFEATMTNCYNTADAYSIFTEGSLVGSIYSYSGSSYIEYCYSSGAVVTPQGKYDSLIGNVFTDSKYTLTSVYQLGGFNESFFNYGGELIRSFNTAKESFYKDFDFENIWIMEDDRPKLRSFTDDGGILSNNAKIILKLTNDFDYGYSHPSYHPHHWTHLIQTFDVKESKQYTLKLPSFTHPTLSVIFKISEDASSYELFPSTICDGKISFSPDETGVYALAFLMRGDADGSFSGVDLFLLFEYITQGVEYSPVYDYNCDNKFDILDVLDIYKYLK